MKSSQLNFYLTREDILEIEEYIKKKGLFIIPQPLSREELQFSNSLTESDGKKIWSDKYLVLKENQNSVKVKYISTQNYYLVDVLDSPVVEFGNCPIKNNVMSRGRIYYVKDIFDSSGKSIDKPSEFLLAASDLIKWIKKQFKPKNSKNFSPIPNMEGILISERTYQWMQKEKGILSDLVNRENYPKARNVA